MKAMLWRSCHFAGFSCKTSDFSGNPVYQTVIFATCSENDLNKDTAHIVLESFSYHCTCIPVSRHRHRKHTGLRKG